MPAPVGRSAMSGDPAPADPAGATPATGTVATSTAWTVVGQVAPMGVTIFLTPFMIHGLGITRYGLFVLVVSLVGFLAILDGGTGGTARRYFSVYAGQDDRRSASELLVTALGFLAVLGALLSVAGWFVAPPLVDVLRMPPHLRPQAIFLFRTLGGLVTLSFFHSVFGGLLQAHSRYAFLTKAGFGCYAVWAVGLVATIHFGLGLRGIAVVFLVQQFLLAATVVPAALRYVDRDHLALMPWPDARAFLGFSGRLQLSSFSYLINTELDNLVVGGVLAVRSVSFYDSGTNFAQNVGGLLLAGLWPAETAVANTFGRSGAGPALAQYRRLQHLWVTVLTGLFAAAGGAAYFAIVSWLGPAFRLAGVIAIVALGTQLALLLTSALSDFCIAIGHPGVYTRAAGVSVVVNLGLMVPLVLTGAAGVAVAALVGQSAGLGYLIRAARRRVDRDIPNPLRSIAVGPGLLTAAAVAGLEWLARPVVPSGGLGLIACAVPAAAGLLVFAGLAFGMRRSFTTGRTLLRRARVAGARTAIAELLADPTA